MLEDIRDIFAVISILIKFEREDIFQNPNLFIEFLNELGFRSNGRALTRQNFTKMVQSLSEANKAEMIEEFNEGHKAVYAMIEMHTNRG